MNSYANLNELQQRWVSAAAVMLRRIQVNKSPDAVRFLGPLMSEIQRQPELGFALFAELIGAGYTQLVASLVSVMSPKLIASTVGLLPSDDIAKVCSALPPVQCDYVIAAIPTDLAQDVERILVGWRKRNCMEALASQIKKMKPPICWAAVDRLNLAQRLFVLDKLGKEFSRGYFLRRRAQTKNMSESAKRAAPVR